MLKRGVSPGQTAIYPHPSTDATLLSKHLFPGTPRATPNPTNHCLHPVGSESAGPLGIQAERIPP